MEELAQNTSGKAYIVPDDDDGSFMDDAFQGSLTYQPGQSITNTNIKVSLSHLEIVISKAGKVFTILVYIFPESICFGSDIPDTTSDLRVGRHDAGNRCYE